MLTATAGSYLFRLDARTRCTSRREDNEVHGAASLEISRADLELQAGERPDDPVRVIYRIPFISLLLGKGIIRVH